MKARTRGQIASTDFSDWFLKPKGDMKELAERTPETSRMVNFQSLKLVDFSYFSRRGWLQTFKYPKQKMIFLPTCLVLFAAPSEDKFQTRLPGVFTFALYYLIAYNKLCRRYKCRRLALIY